jgi:aminoglycoside phosphotransferase (APT) family kinase protein
VAVEPAAIGERIGIGRTAEVYAWGTDRVVKVLRPGFPDGLGEAEAEAAGYVSRLMEAAPRFFGTTRVDGRYGLIYERLAGPSMLDRLSACPWQTETLARELAALHAAMHARNGEGLPDLVSDQRRAIERSGTLLSEHAREASLGRLVALQKGTAICHGDMHPGNVLISATGPVVIDWLTATCGPPAADIARTLFLLLESHIPKEIPQPSRWMIARPRRWFAIRYLHHYRRLRQVDLGEVRLWRLPVLAARLGEGIEPERAGLVARISAELRR